MDTLVVKRAMDTFAVTTDSLCKLVVDELCNDDTVDMLNTPVNPCADDTVGIGCERMESEL